MGLRLENRVIAITGASAGIGAATAVACGRAGMRVVLAARNLDRLRAVAQQVEQTGGEAAVVACDVREDADVQALVDQSVQRFGQLDAMFANAGYGQFGRMEAFPDAEARDVFETNFWGSVRCLRAALAVMRQQGRGHLMVCTSAASEVPIPMYSFYAATKAAQDGLTGSLRAELADEGIHVTSVHPIATRTDFFEVAASDSPQAASGTRFNTPSGMFQPAEAVANAVVKALKRPRPEVWPAPAVRFGIALCTAFPGLSAWAMRRMMRERFRSPT